MAVIAQYPSSEVPFATVYGRQIEGKPRFEVRWKSDGRRQRKTFTIEKDAHTHAKKLAGNISANNGRYITITQDEYQLLQKAKRLGEEALDHALSNTTPHGKTRATVADLRARFLAIYDHRAKRTRDDITARFSIIEAKFGDRYVDTLSTEEIEKWYFSLPGSIRTKNNTLAALTTFLNWARDHDHLPHDRQVPSARVRRVKPLPKDPAILTAAEATIILRQVKKELIPYITLGMFAGLRPSEASGVTGDRDGLLWSDIDLQAKTIRIRRAVAGKTGRPRVIDLHPTLAQWLKPHRPENPATPVCYRTSPEILTQENHRHEWKLPWPTDCIRHSFVSYHFARDRDITATAQQSGNSPAIIESNYNNPRSREEAHAWFQLTPKKVGRPQGKIA